VSNGELFTDDETVGIVARTHALPAGATLLAGYAREQDAGLLAALSAMLQVAPLRHMITPGGHRMSVAMTNCGAYGWVSDERGYRYDARDPVSGAPWPAMPELLRSLSVQAARSAGYPEFTPDACLINRYEPGARMSLHQDKNERDFSAPIVSVSLGLTATFQFGGLQRSDPVKRLPLVHGDVLVWGGSARLVFHGVLPLKDGVHPTLGRQRINLTFRAAGAGR
jgi:alkylated DNA repair protein (DNA oxidative demethylase)